MKKHLTLSVISALVLLCHSAMAQEIPSFIKDSLDTYVERALKDWQIPGVAVCVVKDGNVVVMKGYGIKELGGADKIDENTLFGIGSNTKAFTATALALLQADKKLSLDDHVQKWLPDFTLYDPWVAKEATIRDLLCHRLGFETFQGDFMYFDSDLSTAEARVKFGKLKPLYSFRSKWGYTNAAFMTAGEIIPKVTGETWAAFIKEKLFTPLEMNNTLALSADIDKAANKATAHTVAQGVLKKIPYGQLDNLCAAGSISSSIHDMSHWLLVQLGSGMYNNRQVIPAAAIMETRKPHSIMGNAGHPFNKTNFGLYGLGWFLQDYNSHKIVGHTGGVNGFVTGVTLVPDEKLGIVVLTNTDANNFFDALRWEILDAYLGLPYRNYSKLMLTMNKQEEQQEASWLKQKQDTVAMHLAIDLPLAAFAGNYEHEVYGKMTIGMENGKLVARFQHHHALFVTLEPLGKNRFLATFSDPLYGIKAWPFTIENGKVKSVTVTMADFVEFTPYEFYKK